MALNIGDSLPQFSMQATDGETYSSEQLCGANATVIMFWCNHCPYVIPNQDRIIAMQRGYRDRGVKFAAVCANSSESHPADSFPRMQERAIEKGYNFPYLHDDSQEVAKAFGAQRTPEVFLFDNEQKLAYHGRIDDNHEDVTQATSHDLKNAIEAVLSGSTPNPQQTGAMGCSIKWKQETQQA